MELLIGAGARHKKLVKQKDDQGWSRLITLDINPEHFPDVLHDLRVFPYPFDDDTFDEVHAYEVMEHVGQQGDYKFFFEQWSELWRILKPDGIFAGTSPAAHSGWAWGDPGHTRIVSPECLVFLDQKEYQTQIGQTPMSDYRWIYDADFERVHLDTEGETFVYVLRAVKPSRKGESVGRSVYPPE